jgi:3-isopropylmalate/(R)-2-methylmalate dehydratase small subunit
MRKFDNLKGIPANLPMINVDTDMIIPKQFLKTIKRTGLGKSLFFEMRYDEKGNQIESFILNKEPYNKSSILLAGKNFGCGSSREHAPWALLDFGIQCVISPSFADIFYNNCFKNGILPIKLDQAKVDQLVKEAENKKMLSIDSEDQKIIDEKNNIIKFEIDSFRKKCLLEGLDDIALTLKKIEKIDFFEKKLIKLLPWIV